MYVDAATAQLATASIITMITAPILVDWFDKRLKKRAPAAEPLKEVKSEESVTLSSLPPKDTNSMSVPLYSLRITAVGEYVEYSAGAAAILFSDAVPDDIASYCAVHQASELTAELSPGQQMKLNDKKLSGDRGRPCGNGKFTTAWPYHAKF